MVQIVVRAVITYKNKVLLAKKKDADFWHFPGGKLEKNESLEECAIREICEETDIDIDELGDIIWVKKYEKNDKDYVEFFFLVKSLKDYNKTCSNANDVDSDIEYVKWIELDKASDYIIKPLEVLKMITDNDYNILPKKS
jgi:ADP-ribose pyrophosphatase YjhB (NUDIX family)